jgi:phospholipid-translocating P-type ATPase (flippase)
MSIVVQSQDKTIHLFTKGSDDAIELITAQSFNTEPISRFANEGLRTLCMAGRIVPQNEYHRWRKESFDIANTSIQDRADKMYNSYAQIENNLEYYGTSAIEDALQDGVPETIESLREAGIIVWMLTGDKKETAIQIGYTCKLIDRDTTLIDFDIGIEEALSEAYDSIGDKCIVLQGKHVAKILTNDFCKLASICTSVICCRMSPIQKGQIVKMIKSTGKCSLAIGDGANDVTMLLEANVGVGISGNEGLQAVRAADYAIARFKFLKRLLFVHGRNSSRRMSLVCMYTTYKSFIMALINHLYVYSLLLLTISFAFSSAFSGISLFNTFMIVAYNTIFTNFLPITFIFDKDLSDETLENEPKIYNQSKNPLNYKTVLLWFALTVHQAIVIFITITWQQENVGLLMMTIIMVVQVFMILMNVKSINVAILIYAIGSFVIFATVTSVVSVLSVSRTTVMYHAVEQLLCGVEFYFTVFIASVACMIPLFVYYAGTNNYVKQ